MGDTGQTVLSNLRACLISAQGGVLLRNLNKDYHELLGEDIPYRKFGHLSLESYLRTIPEISVFSKGAELFVEARKTSSSAHISELVDHQKRTGGKRKKGLPSISRGRGRPNRRVPPPRLPTTKSYHNIKKFEPTPARMMFKAPMQPLKTMPVTVYNPEPPRREPPPRPLFPDPVITRVIPNHIRPTAVGPQTWKPGGFQMPVMPVYTTQQSQPEPLRTSIGRGASDKIPPLLPPHMLPRFPPVMPSVNKRLENCRISPLLPETQLEPPMPSPPFKSPPKVSNVAQPDRNVSTAKGEAVEKLAKLCADSGWMEPTYSLVPIPYQGRPRGQPLYHCRVAIIIPEDCPPYTGATINTYTYPEEFSDHNSAREAGAAKALIEAEEMVRDLSQPLPVTKDYEAIEDRIIKLTKESRSGVWADRIRSTYQEKYSESLPQNWISFIGECKHFSIDRYGAGNGIIIKYKQEKGSIPDVELPNSEYLDVYVTHVAKGNELWLRAIGEDYSVKYFNLMISMEQHYSDPARRETPQFVMVNQYYAYYSLEDKYCLRALVTSKGANAVRVFFIDHGDSEDVNVNNLYTLVPEFFELPAQGVKVFLEDVEPLRDDVFALDYLQTAAEGKSLVAQVTSPKPLKARLYDTSVEPQILINEKIYEDLRETKRAPSLEYGQLVEGKVTGLFSWKPVSIQIRSKTMIMLEDALRNENIEKFIKPASPDNKKVVLCKRDNEFLRAKIINFHSNYVHVELVDLGKEDTCSPNDVFEVNDSSGVLDSISPQVVKAILKNIPLKSFGKEMVTKFHEFIAKDNDVVVRLMEEDESGGFPVVEIFKRREESSLLASINGNLLELQAPHKASESIQLEKVEIPLADFYDVYIVECVNPYKISVVPGQYIPQLRSMCQELNSFFRNHRPQSIPDPQPGMLCAVEHKRAWNRGRIHKIISKEQICVKFIDFCNIDVYNASEVRVLPAAFHSVPVLGYTFKLTRIRPTNNDWEISDGFKLSELTEGKRLIAYVYSKIPHSSDPEDFIYEAELYDTTGSKDVDIAELFVKEGRAKYIT